MPRYLIDKEDFESRIDVGVFGTRTSKIPDIHWAQDKELYDERVTTMIEKWIRKMHSNECKSMDQVLVEPNPRRGESIMGMKCILKEMYTTLPYEEIISWLNSDAELSTLVPIVQSSFAKYTPISVINISDLLDDLNRHPSERMGVRSLVPPILARGWFAWKINPLIVKHEDCLTVKSYLDTIYLEIKFAPGQSRSENFRKKIGALMDEFDAAVSPLDVCWMKDTEVRERM